MTKEYVVTTNTYLYNDNGEYINIIEDDTVDARGLEWYVAQQGKDIGNGTVFYVMDTKELK